LTGIGGNYIVKTGKGILEYQSSEISIIVRIINIINIVLKTGELSEIHAFKKGMKIFSPGILC